MEILSLNGSWDLRNESLAIAGEDGAKYISSRKTGWMKAGVPGEVHWDLVSNGLMVEPLKSMNAKQCRWPEDRSWWYRKEFTATPELLACEFIELTCEAIDYYGQIFINGELVGTSENTFVESVYNITGKLHEGRNEIMIRVTVGTELATDQYVGEYSLETPYSNRFSFRGTPELRKPQFSYGWDWVDSLPNIGLWKGVFIRGYSHARVSGVSHSVTLTPDNSSAKVVVTTTVENIHPWSEHRLKLSCVLTAPDGTLFENVQDFIAQVGLQEISLEFTINDPHLWWPNGIGGQPLYLLAVELHKDKTCIDSCTQNIGIKTVKIDRSALAKGHRFAIQINGHDVFCKGGNWIPADAIIARASSEKIESLVRLAAEANFTMLRVWGGGVYESDEFYNACDKYGIMVWQDFMFSCFLYPDNDEGFQNKIRHEAELAVKRLRNHASLTLWCANNENTMGFKEWWNKDKSYPAADLKLGGAIVYGKVLAAVCAALDPEHPYWPGSPCGGTDPNSEDEGDCHWWEPGTMNPDISRRYRHEVYDECRSRFVSEYGVIGPCHINSWNEALAQDELDLSCVAVQNHTNRFEDNTILPAINYHYKEAESLTLEDYIRYGQMYQAWLYGHSLESMRFRKNDPEDDCQGALIWMYNDCWFETGWTPLDYYLRKKASYYAIKNAFYPVRAIVRQRGEYLVTRIINDKLYPIRLTVNYGFMPVDSRDGTGNIQARDVCVPANSMIEIHRQIIHVIEKHSEDSFIYAAWCEGEGIEPAPSILTLCPHRELRQVTAQIDMQVDGNTITLVSPVYCHGVACDDNSMHAFSDHYFDLLPGVPKKILCFATPVPSDLSFSPIQIGRI